jgi:hypothetical protein
MYDRDEFTTVKKLVHEMREAVDLVSNFKGHWV